MSDSPENRAHIDCSREADATGNSDGAGPDVAGIFGAICFAWLGVFAFIFGANLTDTPDPFFLFVGLMSWALSAAVLYQATRPGAELRARAQRALPAPTPSRTRKAVAIALVLAGVIGLPYGFSLHGPRGNVLVVVSCIAYILGPAVWFDRKKP